MTYSILIRDRHGDGYKATALAFPGYEVEAPTREEAISRIREALVTLLEQGEIVELEIATPHAAVTASYNDTFAMFRDDPTFDEFVHEVQQYRKARNRVEEE